MTEDEILKIKEHIEIHARREPGAVKITEIMWKAVDELGRIADLEKDVKLLGGRCNQLLADKGKLTDECKELEAQIEKMKCCGNCKYRDDMTSYCKKHKKEIYIFMVDSKCNDWKLFD